MEDLFVFMVSFVIVFIVYLIIYLIKRRKNEVRKMQEVRVLVGRYKLKNVNYNRLGLIVILINSLIISVTGTVCTMVDTSTVWQLVIGFGLLFSLIIICYGVLGFILKKGSNR